LWIETPFVGLNLSLGFFIDEKNPLSSPKIEVRQFTLPFIVPGKAQGNTKTQRKTTKILSLVPWKS
jgi:hypothetical protein